MEFLSENVFEVLRSSLGISVIAGLRSLLTLLMQRIK